MREGTHHQEVWTFFQHQSDVIRLARQESHSPHPRVKIEMDAEDSALLPCNNGEGLCRGQTSYHFLHIKIVQKRVPDLILSCHA